MTMVHPKSPLHVLLADDDKDDRFFFDKALKKLSVKTHLEIVSNGERLMNYLIEKSKRFPDVLFLDLNMPRKNGSECLQEIKAHNKFNRLPVIIYSTSLYDTIADVLYQKGAHYYMKKSNFSELVLNLQYVFKLLVQGEFSQPSRDEFVVNMAEVSNIN